MKQPYQKPRMRRLPVGSEQPLLNVSLPDIGFGGDLDESKSQDFSLQEMEDALWK